MQRIASIVILMTCLVFGSAAPTKAGFLDSLFDTETLVVIDGEKHTIDDFKQWWYFWREKDTPLPQSPEPYIDWLLLGQEGKRMGLEEDPGFQHQTRVFLQARTLMMLKHDAVDSQVEIPEEHIRQRHEELYLPRWLVQRLVFADEDAAMAAYGQLNDGTVTLEELIQLDSESGGPDSVNESWVRPNGIDPGWAAIFKEMEAGNLVDPEKHKKGQILFVLKEEKGFEEEDLAMFRDTIQKDLSKMRANALTLELIGNLRQKYMVRVDEERLAALDLNAPDDSFTDEPIITSTKKDVSEKEFMAVVRKLMASRPTIAHAAAKPEEASKVKTETVDNIIAQSVTNWEALDRHYEREEPFKWEYDFNVHHRLGVALEQRLFATEGEPSEEEIEEYYLQNQQRFTQPAMVKLYIVDETQLPIEKIWAEVAVGGDFAEVAEKASGQRLAPQDVPANHLDPEVKAVAETLEDGETSPIFEAQGIRVMVHMLKKTPEAVLPLDRVRKSIQAQIEKEKHIQARKEYLERLKSQMEIEVRNRQWKSIQRELGGA